MASAPGYDRQIGIGGDPQLGGASPDAFGASVGAAIQQAGQRLDDVAIRAHRIETEQNRTNQLLGSQAGLANASADSDAYVRDLPKVAPPNKIVEYGLNDWDERTRDLVPADPKAAAHFGAILAEQRAQLSSKLDAMQRGALAGQQVSNAAAASNGIANRVALAPDVHTLGAALDQADHLAGSLDQLDPNQREKFRQELHAQIYSSGVQALNNAGKPADAAAWLNSEGAQAALPAEHFDALISQTRVAQDRVTSQAKAAAHADFTTQVKALDLTGQQYDQGRPTFDQAKAQADQYRALVGVASTPEDKAQAAEKAQNWQAKAVEIGASESMRGATPQQRDARIAELAAKPTLSAAEGSELKGLRGQAGYVNGLPTLQRYTYATGKAVAPIDWNDPASIQQRAATWSAAQAQYGGAPDFLLPGEEAPAKEIVKGGNAEQKVSLFQTITRLPGPAARQTLDMLTQGDDALRSAATLAAIDDGGERMRLALQGIDAQKANKEIWTRQRDDQNKSIGPTHEELWASYAPALAGLPTALQAALRSNTFNLYAGSAAKMGWHDFKPDELGRSLRFALGGGKVNGVDAGGIGTWQGQQVLLPKDMGQADFEKVISRATAAQWGSASVNGVAWAGNRALTTGEARGLVPVLVDPSRGLYSLRQGNAYVHTKEGRPYLFDVHRLR